MLIMLYSLLIYSCMKKVVVLALLLFVWIVFQKVCKSFLFSSLQIYSFLIK